jgi:hypothetical protein
MSVLGRAPFFLPGKLSGFFAGWQSLLRQCNTQGERNELKERCIILSTQKIQSVTSRKLNLRFRARKLLLSLSGIAVAGIMLGASPAMARDRHEVHGHIDRSRRVERHADHGRVVRVWSGRRYDNGNPDPNYTDDGQPDSVVDNGAGDSSTIPCPPPVDPLVQRNAARDAMDQVQARLTADRQASPDWTQMTSNVSQGLSDLESAQTRIEESLNERPDYRAAIAQKQAAQEGVDQMNASGDASPEEMTPLAQNELAARKLTTHLQTQALSSDPQWLDARARLQSSAAGRDAMQSQLHAALLNDPQWQAARLQLD